VLRSEVFYQVPDNGFPLLVPLTQHPVNGDFPLCFTLLLIQYDLKTVATGTLVDEQFFAST